MNDTERRRLGWIYAGHLVLAALMTSWRMLESTPGIASASGGTFSASVPGRAFAVVSILAGVTALATVTILTIRMWRSWPVLVLFVALVAAIRDRKGVDVFDVTYLMLVAIFATLWFDRRRKTAST